MAKGKYQKWLEPESLILLEGWARDGLTDKQIAKNIGILANTPASFCKYIRLVKNRMSYSVTYRFVNVFVI